MNKARLEAFSDGVFAIIITIMVLEIKLPHEVTLAALLHLAPVFIGYAVSFVFIGIYWVNHHHIFHMVKRVDTRILWANMALLFPLSLVPFATGWIGENPHQTLPMAVYCSLFLLSGFGAYILQAAITAKLQPDDKIFLVFQKNLKKTIFSVIMYCLAIACAFIYPDASFVLILIVSVAWVIPNPEIEKVMEE